MSESSLHTPAGRRRRWFVPLVIGLLCLALGWAVTSSNMLPIPRSSCAGCGGSGIQAVAAFDEMNVVGVGATESDRLLLVRTADGGRTWSIEHPNAPALKSLALAGSRLYGSIDCLPTYPPEAYPLPSGADVYYGSGVDHSFYPAPVSCLYYSDDRGRTWYDTGAGHLIDPTFADASNGWAHGPYDDLGKTPTTLYSTIDGGRSWQAQPTPCDSATPWIQQAVSTGPRSGYALCFARSDWTVWPADWAVEPPIQASWELVRVAPAGRTIVLSSSSSLVPANSGVGTFFMRADGAGWIYTDRTGPEVSSDGSWVWTASLYRTADGGQSWEAPIDASNDWLGSRFISFVSPTVGFAAFTSTGARSGVSETTDGGRTWRLIALWDWWSFDPIPLPS